MWRPPAQIVYYHYYYMSEQLAAFLLLSYASLHVRLLFVFVLSWQMSLPSSVTASETLGIFWRRLKTHLFAVSLSLQLNCAAPVFIFVMFTVYSALKVFLFT